MLFRAVFWIGVVAVLMPHEPDLGLGRPHGMRGLISRSESDEVARDANLACEDESGSCPIAHDMFAAFRSVTVRSLNQVRAELEADDRARAGEISRAD